ncbi:hypothetical protein NG799_09370 [Laspinema sp. D1]|uniref:Uncharacterized protein n=1 Tax=Laspinema palackyanum D2a TaxID=2953684 RepID=A0ABT2MRB8_9CYAN|nr:hypothetical protein [Laspinema sp. D2b]MCT7966540.1 hypothetical protein [Laspinema sp. D2a]
MAFSQATDRDSFNPSENLLAVLSGDSIYIVYPNGKVEAIASQFLERSRIKTLLQRCQVWGDLAAF